MIWDSLDAIARLGREVFAWATGGRTKGENILRDEADHWKEEYDKAMANRDYQTATFAMQQLRRVRDKARAQRGA